jgi:hypothetical protein
MARTDGSEATNEPSGNSGGDSGIATVDIGQVVSEQAARNDANSRGASGRVRRTRAELEAAGYYEGKDTKPTAARSSRPVATAPKGSIDVNSVQFALTGIHALLAAGMAAPELELTETEAETVAKNIVAVTRHYDLQQTAKATDWGNLVVSLGVVYGGRLIRISSRKKAEKAARRGAVAPGTGFVPTAPNTAPQQPQVKTPIVDPKVGVATRPKTREDDALLNEMEPFLAP